jgi:UDP-2,3-diacylglucosamine pyrophosphatase LpxH
VSLHDDFLSEVSKAATHVRLVAALKHDGLNFAAKNDLRVFIPDLHVVSRATRRKYDYGTNDTELLADVLTRIANLKARSQGSTVAVYQVGDFLDLWREEPVASARVDAASRIVSDHPALMNAFFSPSLKARFLLGNHDVDLAWWPNFIAWERRYFLPPRGSLKPSGIALHGDVFDWVEMLPDALNQFFVYFFSPFSGPSDHDLRDARTIITRENAKSDFSARIAGAADLGSVQASGSVQANGSVPRQHNLGSHKFLDKARKTVKAANKSFGLDLRFAVIGHTHHARIAVHDAGDNDFFALIDCGGWIEDAHDATGAKYPNQTLAVISENEARIYQVER